MMQTGLWIWLQVKDNQESNFFDNFGVWGNAIKYGLSMHNYSFKLKAEVKLLALGRYF